MSHDNDIRTTAMLVCAILAGAIAVSALTPKRRRRAQGVFFFFAADIALWYLSQSVFVLSHLGEKTPSEYALIRTGVCFALALPYLALLLFDAMVPPAPSGWSASLHAGLIPSTLAAVAAVFVFDPHQLWVQVVLLLFVFASLTAVLASVHGRGARSPLGVIRRRVRSLVLIGALACLATVADIASTVWAPGKVPPVGAVVSLLFLFALREALHAERLLDVRELFTRLLVATLLGTSMAAIFFLFSRLPIEGLDQTYMTVVLGATVCLSYDTLRAQVETKTRWLLRERSTLEAAAEKLRGALRHILTVEEMSTLVIDGLHASRRLTSAALYLRDADDTGFDCAAALAARLPRRIEVATTRPLLDRLSQGPLTLEEVERDLRTPRITGARPDPRDEAILAATAALGLPAGTAVAGIHDEADDLIGLLVVVSDEGTGGPLSARELSALHDIAGHIRVVIENSRVYAEMKARDRLAVIGHMTAGLAHEIRNPLGSIKGAAQLLTRLHERGAAAPDPGKYLNIIVEEVDRLTRVLDSVLDLAPRQPTVAPIDVNAVVRRTLQVLSSEPGHDDLEVREALDPELPRVVIDPEQLQQVLLNLLRNAAQATQGKGKVIISTASRSARGSFTGVPVASDSLVEIKVADNGPGLSRKVLDKLFMPFFSTKKEGTGLGLAISQKIIQESRGRIEAWSHEGAGTTFAITLPAAMDALGTPRPGPVVA